MGAQHRAPEFVRPELRDSSLARQMELGPTVIRSCPRRSHGKRRQIEQRRMKLHRILAGCMHLFLDDNIGLLIRDFGEVGAIALCGPAQGLPRATANQTPHAATESADEGRCCGRPVANACGTHVQFARLVGHDGNPYAITNRRSWPETAISWRILFSGEKAGVEWI